PFGVAGGLVQQPEDAGVEALAPVRPALALAAPLAADGVHGDVAGVRGDEAAALFGGDVEGGAVAGGAGSHAGDCTAPGRRRPSEVDPHPEVVLAEAELLVERHQVLVATEDDLVAAELAGLLGGVPHQGAADAQVTALRVDRH